MEWKEISQNITTKLQPINYWLWILLMISIFFWNPDQIYLFIKIQSYVWISFTKDNSVIEFGLLSALPYLDRSGMIVMNANHLATSNYWKNHKNLISELKFSNQSLLKHKMYYYFGTIVVVILQFCFITLFPLPRIYFSFSYTGLKAIMLFKRKIRYIVFFSHQIYCVFSLKFGGRKIWTIYFGNNAGWFRTQKEDRRLILAIFLLWKLCTLFLQIFYFAHDQ